MNYFSEDQVRKAAKPAEVIRAIREVFARDFHATLQMPVRTSLQLSAGILLMMPCHDSALPAAGVKIVSVSGEAGVSATYLLVDPATGKGMATMEANYLTDVRTAATSAVATGFLARQDARTLGIFGSGRQAIAHLAVLPRVRTFRRFLVCGSGRRNLKGLAAQVKEEQGINIELVDAQTCVRESEVLCACTNAREPLFDGRWLRPGTHLNLIGTFQPDAREVDTETVRRSRVVVDTREGALAEAGDLLIPLAEGAIDSSHIIADLHEIASGKKIGRTSPEEITLFKSVGCALEDLVTARLVYEDFRRSASA
ncbi:MAG TPA: ornithine cyclodeaminase family protein [Candidatus Angelobacter sp.]|nr:ornithine cyclodeaminase family protein [Candidatus Angelobacter sp.]